MPRVGPPPSAMLDTPPSADALARVIARTAEQMALGGHADAAREALEFGLLRGWSRAVARDAGTGHAGSAVEWTEDDHDAA